MIADINYIKYKREGIPAGIGIAVRNAARMECCFACSLNASHQRLFDNYSYNVTVHLNGLNE